MGKYEGVYRHIHQNPDLSKKEAHTADYVSAYLEQSGLRVIRNIGGHGVVGILENGPGKIVMLRAELDALPMKEQTNLSYARMLSIRPGPILVSAEAITIRIYGSMGFKANPQIAIDPVLVASKILVQLPALAKSLSDGEYSSINAEEIHAGQPWAVVEYVDIVLEVKAYNSTLRQTLVDAVIRLVEDTSKDSQAKSPPRITTLLRAPVTNNSNEVVATLSAVFKEYLGDHMVIDRTPNHPCEDFSVLATSQNIPYAFWFLGRVDEASWNDAERRGNATDCIPTEHSPYNAPVIQPTLRTGTDALSLAALTFFDQDDF
jgi:metal-dependent amidase/aminoacylase/carboxypeptidase family protein